MSKFTSLPDSLLDEVRILFSDSDFTFKENDCEIKGKVFDTDDYIHNVSIISDFKDLLFDFFEENDIEYDISEDQNGEKEETLINFSYDENEYEVKFINNAEDGFMSYKLSLV